MDWSPHLVLSRLYDYVQDANIQTGVGYKQGSPYGYFELESKNESTEIVCFGIFKQFFGQGLGAHLLGVSHLLHRKHIESSFLVP